MPPGHARPLVSRMTSYWPSLWFWLRHSAFNLSAALISSPLLAKRRNTLRNPFFAAGTMTGPVSTRPGINMKSQRQTAYWAIALVQPVPAQCMVRAVLCLCYRALILNSIYEWFWHASAATGTKCFCATVSHCGRVPLRVPGQHRSSVSSLSLNWWLNQQHRIPLHYSKAEQYCFRGSGGSVLNYKFPALTFWGQWPAWRLSSKNFVRRKLFCNQEFQNILSTSIFKLSDPKMKIQQSKTRVSDLWWCRCTPLRPSSWPLVVPVPYPPD